MSYDSESRQFAGQLVDRFPANANGVTPWKMVARSLPTDMPQLGRPSQLLVTPRIFVSYKSQDRQYALRLAYLCNQQGFEYWMDVLDPTLTSVNLLSSTQQKSVLIATIIEMALLNSSHVIATITNRTATSQWVAYEFGRVKDQTVVASESGSWIHPTEKPSVAEYLYLCPRHTNEAALNR